MKNMSKRAKSNIILTITALIWGSTFIAQKTGGYIGTFTFCAMRGILATIALGIVVLIMDRARLRKGDPEAIEKSRFTKTTFIGGFVVGIFLFLGTVFQQQGLVTASAGEAGFITTLYVVLVPLIGIFMGRRIGPLVWAGAVLAAVGLYYLCTNGEGLKLEPGAAALLMCAFTYSFQVISVGKYSPLTDVVKLSLIETATFAVLSFICMLIFEDPSFEAIKSEWFAVAYAGILSSTVGYTLQLEGQKGADPTEASLIMCLESVFAMFFGAVLLHERMGGYQLFGCLLIFIAIVIAQLPDGFVREKLEKFTK